MVKNWFLVGVILLVVSLLVVGCGIPTEDYDAAVADKEAAKAKVASLQSDLSEAQSQISSLESEVSSLQSIVSSLRIQVSALTSELAIVEKTVTSTPIAALSKDYSKYAFGFDYPKGFSVTEMGMLASEANDNSGLVQVGIENGEIELFQVSWLQMTQSTWQFSGGLRKLLDDSFAGIEAGAGGVPVDRGEQVETTKAGHQMIYQYCSFTFLDYKAYGIVAAFYCDVSQRVYQLVTLNSTISAKQDVFKDFQNYLDSFVGH
ncbi:hypothetical protein ACFLTR_02695 [Chloroflexota bacterium]